MKTTAPHSSLMGYLCIFLLGIGLLINGCGQAEKEPDPEPEPEPEPQPVQEAVLNIDPPVAEVDTFKFANLDEIRLFFRAANFSTESWAAGDRSIPRFYLASVPSRWRHEVAPNLTPQKKKQYFFFVYTPLVLAANESILQNRTRLLELSVHQEWNSEEENWLRDLAAQYSLDIEAGDPLDVNLLEELKRRVDGVPPGLALAQAAVESGWSTSRFSDLGNALFGQWTWSKDGITPEAQRGDLGNYKIRSFDSPDQSIAAYMHNLNTHRSYRSFRRERAKQRAAGEIPDGKTLASTLTSYSEKGQEYVATLLSVIRVNHLDQMDKTFLRDMKPVMLVPVGEGAD